MAATTSLLARAVTAISDKASLPIRAAAAATVAVGTLFGAHTVSGQQLADHAKLPPPPAPATVQRLPEHQCFEAVAIGSAIQERFRGRISTNLIDSFLQFNRSNCDLATRFVRVEGTADEQAFGEFRVRLIALRMSSASTPTPLTK